MGSQQATDDPAARRRVSEGTPLGRTAWRVALTAIILMVIFVGAERITAAVTQHRLATRIEKAEHLRRSPEVNLRGFPFLSQAIRGRYRTVDIRAADPILTDGLRVDHAAVTSHDARVRLSDVAYGTVSKIPVGSATGHAVVPYYSINAAVKRYGVAAGSAVTVVGADPGGARLQGLLGMSVAVTAKVNGGKFRRKRHQQSVVLGYWTRQLCVREPDDPSAGLASPNLLRAPVTVLSCRRGQH